MTSIKLTKFQNSVIKPAAIVSQDCVENHCCEVRACNGQNNNPTYLQQEATQNSIHYGQTTISGKSNAGASTAQNLSSCTIPKITFNLLFPWWFFEFIWGWASKKTKIPYRLPTTMEQAETMAASDRQAASDHLIFRQTYLNQKLINHPLLCQKLMKMTLKTTTLPRVISSRCAETSVFYFGAIYNSQSQSRCCWRWIFKKHELKKHEHQWNPVHMITNGP